MNKKLILTIFIVVILIFGIYQAFLRKKEPAFTLAKVSRGTISQEISETGQVKKGEEIKLSFKSAGQIEKIYVEVGEEVKSGEKLVKINNTSLLIELQTAQSGLDLAQAKLDKLFAGSSLEEIKIAETEVANTQISLTAAQENLEQAFEDAQNILNDSYLKIYNAFNTVDSIQRTYFVSNDQERIKVRENTTKIGNAMAEVKPYLDAAKADPKDENIDIALSEMKKALESTSESLKVIRETCETTTYRNTVSSTDKASLDDQRTYINTALTNVTNSQQTISSKKLSVETAEGQLQAAKDSLSLVIAEPRQEDIDLYQAQVDQAKAQVRLLENQIGDTILKSPVDGQVTKINKKIGEQVQPMLQDVVMTLLPATPFEIEVDIYEEDVVKIQIGNLVDISLVAFPDQIFKGKVISIDPAEKLIEGVVYYEVAIGPSEIENWIPDKVKPGMTADLTIQTAIKENVLIVPEEAIQKKDGKTIVEVLKDGTPQAREIAVGLLGSNDMVEVISGLKEGEEVVLR